MKKEQRLVRLLGTNFSAQEEVGRRIIEEGWSIVNMRTSACNGIDVCWLLLECEVEN